MKKKEIFFEEYLTDEWSGDLEVVEVPLDEKPLLYVGLAAVLLGLLVGGRIFFLSSVRAEFYGKRAEANLGREERIAAPRGVIVDRYGKSLAENQTGFSALLHGKEFLKDPASQPETLRLIREILGISEEEVWKRIGDRDWERSADPLLLDNDLDQSQLVALKGAGLPTLSVASSFRRDYLWGPAFGSVLGYIGFTSPSDIEQNPELSGQDLVGKSGIEASYDGMLRGKLGARVQVRDAQGSVLMVQERSKPEIGRPLETTIDADLQEYFFERMSRGLRELGRQAGVGLAMDPRTGEVLAYLNFPAYDNDVFNSGGRSEERQKILSDPNRPLFNRAISGLYSPGSTIKPLVGLAAVQEGVISAERTIFSPGYLDVPNPYDPEKPTRFVDWRYQGDVDLSAALAQSSNVYFYEVGGGFGDIRGLGINRLREWWQRFGFGKSTGIDLFGEEEGFLPTPEWKERVSGDPWLLGDTYNVSIGQGDLLVTPIQLLNYTAALANGGVFRKPALVRGKVPEVIGDISKYEGAFLEVRRGMRETVTSPLGTAKLLDDLPIAVAAKTGSAQTKNKAEENAFFIGFAPYEEPEIAILVLVENAKEGSLNAVPIAKDVFRWYAEHRIQNLESRN